MAEPPAVRRQPGWRDVLLVAAAVVAVVMGAAIVTGLLPPALQDLVYRTPLAIIVLLVGTGWLLWRITRRSGSPPR